MVQDKDDGAGGLSPGKEENAVMCWLFPLNCCLYF